MEQKILPGDPFESIDQTGVGQLMEIAVAKGKSTNPDLKLGITCRQVSEKGVRY